MSNQPSAPTQVALSNKRPSSLAMKLKNFTVPFFMMAPFLILFMVFTVIPVFWSLYLSFTEYNAIQAPSFIGTQNYQELLADPRFFKALSNTTFYVVTSVVLSNVLGLALAMVFGSQKWSDQFFRSVFFLPSIAGGLAITAVWKWIFNSEDFGLMNTILSIFHIDPVRFLGDPRYAMPITVVIAVWGGMGYSMILYLAGLRSVPSELYEAAAIDGANPTQRFFRITIPLLKPTILFVVITGIIGAFQVFDGPYLLFASVANTGGILDSGLTLVMLLFDKGFRLLELGKASALAWILLVIIFVLTLINMRLGRSNQES